VGIDRIMINQFENITNLSIPNIFGGGITDGLLQGTTR